LLPTLRPRLTFANVGVVLALLFALGGPSFAANAVKSAAHRITGKNIKNRSITRADLRKNTLTGTEINERKLGQVPSALNSKNAQSADTAGVAGMANDAKALAGQGAASFEKSSRTDFGLAAIPTAPPQEKAVIAWPALGAEVRTITGVCPGSNMQMAVTNTRATGGGAITVFEGNTAMPITPGNTQNVCSHAVDQTGADLAHLNMQVGDSGPNGRAWFVQCIKAFSTAQEERCLGVRSEP
jgi:hypothetical protein